MQAEMRMQIAGMSVAVVLGLGALVSVSAAGTEVPGAAKTLGYELEKALGGARDQLLIDQMAAFAQYSNGLVSASAKCGKVGDLDGVMDIGAELKKLAKAAAIPEKDGPETPAVICTARSGYRAAMGKAKAAFDRRQRSLIERNISDLDAVKKKLTVDGKYDEAVAVRDLIAKARESLDRLAPVPADPAENGVRCYACSGTGKKMGRCTKCSGGGLCGMCGGEGVKQATMVGVSDRMACVTCKKSGKCPQCQGSGTVPTRACDICQGTGKVQSETPAGVESEPRKNVPLDGRSGEAVAGKDPMVGSKDSLDRSSPARAKPDVGSSVCYECSGTGKSMVKCPKCSGNGLCVMCKGEGLKQAAMVGISDRLACVTCKKTGKCPQCQGAGTVPGPACRACQGTGKARSAAP